MFGDIDAQAEAKRLQESLWTRCGQAGPHTVHGVVRFGTSSMTPPSNGQYWQHNPGDRFQNRVHGTSVCGDGGAVPAPQYTPQPFGGFNTGQPHCNPTMLVTSLVTSDISGFSLRNPGPAAMDATGANDIPEGTEPQMTVQQKVLRVRGPASCMMVKPLQRRMSDSPHRLGDRPTTT